MIGSKLLANFIQRYRNAKKCIEQIRQGLWVPRYNSISKQHITAEMGELELWIGNGGMFCDIRPGKDYFGEFWKYYVWWAAARKLKRDADEKYKGVPVL